LLIAGGEGVDMDTEGEDCGTEANTAQGACRRSREPAQGGNLGWFLGESHNSPFKAGGIEDANGVRGSGRHPVDKQRGEPQKRASVLMMIDKACSQLVADHLASFHQAGAGEGEDGVKADGHREKLVQDILEEVLPTHVGEFVGNGSAEFSIRHRRKHARGQKHELAIDADGDRTVDL